MKYSKEYAYEKIKRDFLQLSPLQISDISDILEGSTYGKIKIGYGHGIGYWKKGNLGNNINENLATEAFAEMFSISIVNKQSLEIIKKYLPNSYKVFEEIIGELTK